jgi:NAD(P)-dependent dehydrogenase (short-subunit alcohol dehydrogenase family)
MSFLELEGLHVFVTGAAGGIGSAIVEEFLGKSWYSCSTEDDVLFRSTLEFRVGEAIQATQTSKRRL